MATRYREEEHYSLGGGIYRAVSPIDPKYPDDALVDALNMVYHRESDNPQRMFGVSRIGTTDMGGTVTGLFDYNNGDKLVAAATDGKIYQFTASNWAEESGARATGNSTAAGTRWSATMFYGATTVANLLILANGVDAPAKYNNTDVTDLGGSPPATGDFPVVWQGRLWLFSGSTAHYSAVDDAEDFTTASGGGSVNIYRGHDGDITGAHVFGNNLFIFKRSSVYRIPPITQLLNDLQVLNVSSVKGCVSHRTIQEIGPGGGDFLCWFSEHGIEAVTPSYNLSGFRPVDVGRSVKDFIDRKNTAGMSSAWAIPNLDRLEYYVNYPTAAATTPTMGLIGNFARARGGPRWTRTDRTNLTAGVMFVENNTDYIQYVGDTNGRVYKMHDSDVDTWNGAAYTGRVQSRYYTQGKPNYMKHYGYSHVFAETDGDYQVLVKQTILRRGLPSTSGTNTQGLGQLGVPSGWGVGEWGVALWGVADSMAGIGEGQSGIRLRPQAVARGNGLQLTVEATNYFRTVGWSIASRLAARSTRA